MIIGGFHVRPRENFNLKVWEINFTKPGTDNFFQVIYDKDPYLYPETPSIDVIVESFDQLEEKFNLKTFKRND